MHDHCIARGATVAIINRHAEFKVFTADATHLRTAYPMVPTFTDLAAKHDPTGKFRNPYLDTYLPTA